MQAQDNRDQIVDIFDTSNEWYLLVTVAASYDLIDKSVIAITKKYLQIVTSNSTWSYVYVIDGSR